MLFVEHDMEIVARFADRVLAFYDGTVIADGAPAAVLADQQGADPHQRHQAFRSASKAIPMLSVSDLDVSIGPVPVIRKGLARSRRGRRMCGLIASNGAGEEPTLLRAPDGRHPGDRHGQCLGEVDLLALPPHGRVGFGIGYMPEDRAAWCPISPSNRTSGCRAGPRRPTGWSSVCNGSSRSCRRSRRFARAGR